MTSTREQLKEAYRLIRQDRPQDAEQLLRPILDAEPDNVHAWWLLAYSVDDPYEVRDALHKVLSLDPGYSNAPKAREMLATLEEQFFAAEGGAAPITYEDGDYDDDDVLLEDSAAHVAAQSPGYDEEYSTVDSSFFVEDGAERYGTPTYEDTELPDEADLFTVGDEIDLDQEPDDLLFPEGAESALDEAAQAADEERRGRRAGRGCVRVALLLVLVLVVVFAGFMLLNRSNDESGDPGALVALNADAEPLASVVVATEQDVTSAALGMQQKALLAESPLGDTLFVEFCGMASDDLSQNIALAMQIAAQHAAQVSDAVDAVGVSVNRCDASQHDTLYRAFVPIADAVSYLNGDFGTAQTGWAKFQQLWQKS